MKLEILFSSEEVIDAVLPQLRQLVNVHPKDVIILPSLDEEQKFNGIIFSFNISSILAEKCKFCDSTNIIKYGISNNKQVFKCKSCDKKFVVGEEEDNTQAKEEARKLHEQGMSYGDISKKLEDIGCIVDRSTVWRWLNPDIPKTDTENPMGRPPRPPGSLKVSCPKCKSDDVNLGGFDGVGKRRYRCKSCKSQFTERKDEEKSCTSADTKKFSNGSKEDVQGNADNNNEEAANLEAVELHRVDSKFYTPARLSEIISGLKEKDPQEISDLLEKDHGIYLSPVAVEKRLKRIENGEI